MMQTFTPGLWNNPQRVFESRGRIPKPQGMIQTPDRALSQPATSAPLPSAQPKTTGIPTGVYIGGAVLVLAVIGIFAIRSA
jgi:hypothetical protein